jgi:hypothetical protein
MELARIDASDKCRQFDLLHPIYYNFYISLMQQTASDFVWILHHSRWTEYPCRPQNVLVIFCILPQSTQHLLMWAMQLQGTGHFVTNCSAVCDGACLKSLITQILLLTEVFSHFQNVLMCWYRALSTELTFRMLDTVKLIYTTINHSRSLKWLLNTGTGQQVGQLHDSYMLLLLLMMMMTTQP